jgi:SAM-dependent methyltransferase
MSYPVVDGIPILLPTALREAMAAPEDVSEAAEKQREMAARDAQVVDYDKMLGLRVFTTAEVPMSLHYLRPDADSLMLEGGCGTGRMTPAFVDAARGLMALDFSVESIKVARGKLTPEQLEKVLFIQADLSKLPIASEVFDRVGSFGVYEHIPTPDARARALAEMARVLKPRTHGSRFALSAYRWGPPQSWGGEREGHHAGGIYFYRFTQSELRAQVQPYFEVREFTESLLYYHLLWGRKPA